MLPQYIKRLQMVFDFANFSFPSWRLPTGFRYVSWQPSMLSAHADVKYRGFRNDSDARIFPTFRDYDRCVKLMESISASPSFLPEATLLIANGNEQELFEYVACIQGMRLSGEIGAIQNVAVLPDYRCRGIGRALVLGSLWGFQKNGIQRVTLEVTADNIPATKLYTHVGFKTFNVHFHQVIDE